MTKKFKPSFEEEIKFWEQGYTVIGIDEVGRGAFAGPVVVAAVVFNKDTSLPGIDDSKRLRPKTRELLSKLIQKHCLHFAIAQTSVSIINRVGIGKATQVAFRKVILKIRKKFQNEKIFLLVDGFYIPYVRFVGRKHQHAFIKGDQKSISIAAASIIAKVYRDQLMHRLHTRYSIYNFSRNKGYGTKEHREAIKRFGLSKLHRLSFNLYKYTV